MEKTEEFGIVYVLTNEGMPGLVKIGMTRKGSQNERLKNLYTTGVPFRFEAVYACKVKAEDCLRIEQALHKAFEPDRVNPKREFFRMNPDRAIAILSLFNQEDVTDLANKELNDGVTPEETQAQLAAKTEKDAEMEEIKTLREERSKRPPLNYFELGIGENDSLHWKADPSKFVTVCGDKKVIFEGRVTSLTKVTQELLGIPYNVQPSPYWLYNGTPLIDLYNTRFPPIMDE